MSQLIGRQLRPTDRFGRSVQIDASAMRVLARSSLAGLLCLCAVFPTVLQPEKIVLLAFAMLLLLLLFLRGQLTVVVRQHGIVIAALGYACFGALWVAYGELAGNPGALSMAPVHSVYPILLTSLGFLVQPGDIERLKRLLTISAILVLLVQLAFLLSFLGLDGKIFFSWVQGLREDVAVVDVSQGSLAFTLPNVNTLMFLGPFLLLEFVFSRSFKLHAILLGGISLVLLLLAGRRAAFPAVGLGLVVAFASARLCVGDELDRSRAYFRIGVIGVMVGLAAAALFGSGLLSVDTTLDEIRSMFEFARDDSNVERRLQFDALMSGIGRSPVFGLGAGAVASYVRSSTQPWTYELSYVSLVFHFGVVGFVLYVCGVLYLLRVLLDCVKNAALSGSERRSALCYFGGVTSFLVANATNPYLSKFDYMWVLFAPVAFALAGFHISARTGVTTVSPDLVGSAEGNEVPL